MKTLKLLQRNLLYILLTCVLCVGCADSPSLVEQIGKDVKSIQKEFEKGYTATEVHAKIKSIYTNVLYRQSPSLKFYLTMFLLMIIEGLALHIIYSNYFVSVGSE